MFFLDITLLSDLISIHLIRSWGEKEVQYTFVTDKRIYNKNSWNLRHKSLESKRQSQQTQPIFNRFSVLFTYVYIKWNTWTERRKFKEWCMSWSFQYVEINSCSKSMFKKYVPEDIIYKIYAVLTWSLWSNNYKNNKTKTQGVHSPKRTSWLANY